MVFRVCSRAAEIDVKEVFPGTPKRARLELGQVDIAQCKTLSALNITPGWLCGENTIESWLLRDHRLGQQPPRSG